MQHKVIQAIDRLLSDRPDKVGHDFSEATQRLSAYRESLIERWRQTHAPEYREAMERANAALSVIVGGQFPLGAVPWAAIEQARTDLAELIG